MPETTHRLALLAPQTGSRFPKVRRTAAELLYVRLLTTPADALREEGFPVTDEGMDGAQDTLVSNAWVSEGGVSDMGRTLRDWHCL